MSFLHKMKNCFLFCRIYNRVCHLRQTAVASVLMGISAQTQFLINILDTTEINILEEGLDFAPISNKSNNPELRNDFEEFSWRMRIENVVLSQ